LPEANLPISLWGGTSASAASAPASRAGVNGASERRRTRSVLLGEFHVVEYCSARIVARLLEDEGNPVSRQVHMRALSLDSGRGPLKATSEVRETRLEHYRSVFLIWRAAGGNNESRIYRHY